MDVWLEVEPGEIHYVQHLLPTLEWNGGLLGVRLRLEPKELELFHKEYVSVRQHAISTIAAANDAAKKSKSGRDYKVPLWPSCMKDFLDRGFASKFSVRSYILDPSKLVAPKGGLAKPQTLPPTAEYIEEKLAAYCCA